MRDNFPKRPSDVPLTTLSKLYEVPVVLLTTPSFEAVNCLIFSLRWVAVTDYRMICRVILLVESVCDACLSINSNSIDDPGIQKPHIEDERQGKTYFNFKLPLILRLLMIDLGAAVAEWLSSWLADQEDRSSISGLATSDWLSPASKSRYGWKIAKSTLILKTTSQPNHDLFLFNDRYHPQRQSDCNDKC